MKDRLSALAKKDDFYMEMALDLAARGVGHTSPNPMVGAVVVKDRKVVGRGYHAKAGGPHAEVVALDDAGDLAAGATLYVTLEPCNHYGRTPPCTKKILDFGIKRVVGAMKDPNPDVRGGGFEFLKQHGVSVTTGVREDHALALNQFFIKHVRTKRPFVILKNASTLDGRIASVTGDSKWVTGKIARALVHRIRHAVDGIMVGIGTVKTDNPSLTTRLDGGSGKDPVRIILDSHLSIPHTAKLLHLNSNADTIVVTGKDVSEEKRNALEKTGAQVFAMELVNGRIPLDGLMDHLGAMNIGSLLIEGGSRISWSAAAAGIVDKVFLFYAPKFIGGDDGVPIFRGPGARKMADAYALKHVRVHSMGNDVLIEGVLNDSNIFPSPWNLWPIFPRNQE